MAVQESQSPASTRTADALTSLVVTDEIRRLKARYTRLLDTQQWAELTTLFVEDAHFTLASFGAPLVFDSTADWIGYVAPLLDGGTTVHQVHQAEIEVLDADTASARWAMTDHVVPAAGSRREPFHGYGHYLEQYRRIAGSWKIVDLELTRLMLNSGTG